MTDGSDREWKWLGEPGRYRFGRGLYLQVWHEHNRSWIFRYQLHGRQRELGLGSAGPVGGERERGQRVVTLADAGKLVDRARGLLAQRIDPIEHKRSARVAPVKSVTFAEAVDHVAEVRRDIDRIFAEAFPTVFKSAA